MTSNRYKIVVVGDGACGKTSLLTVFNDGEFPTEHIPTIFETDVANLRLEPEGEEVELALWDTAGQEEYDKLRPLSYPNTDVVLICFSIDRCSSVNQLSIKKKNLQCHKRTLFDCRPESLRHVESQWSSEVRHFCRGVPVILVRAEADVTCHFVFLGGHVSVRQVANKTDLRDDPATLEALREEEGDNASTITREETRATAGRIRAEAFAECSALRGEGVQVMYTTCNTNLDFTMLLVMTEMHLAC